MGLEEALHEAVSFSTALHSEVKLFTSMCHGCAGHKPQNGSVATVAICAVPPCNTQSSFPLTERRIGLFVEEWPR